MFKQLLFLFKEVVKKYQPSTTLVKQLLIEFKFLKKTSKMLTTGLTNTDAKEDLSDARVTETI